MVMEDITGLFDSGDGEYIKGDSTVVMENIYKGIFDSGDGEYIKG